MTEAVSAIGGIVLMIAGVLAIIYSACIDLAHAPAARWYDRPMIVAPTGVVLLLVGAVLVAR